MADPIQSFLSSYHEQSEALHIPRANCCCGNDACAYLKHNQTALDGLERDVSTAARLGKVCATRIRVSSSKVLRQLERDPGRKNGEAK